MKRTIRIIVIIVALLIISYALFLTEESIRIEKGGEPLIILNGTCEINEMPYDNGYETICRSLGFKLKRRYAYEFTPASDVRRSYIIKEEFWLFNKFLIWGWIS